MSYQIEMTCYDVDPSIQPYKMLRKELFSTRDEAEMALFDIADAEADELNSGDAEGEFCARFDNAIHDAVTEFWEGPPTENDRSFRVVTEYDIVATGEEERR